MRNFFRPFLYRCLVHTLCLALALGLPTPLLAADIEVVVGEDRVVPITEDSTAPTRYQLGEKTDRSGSLSFSIATGATLTFSGLVNSSDDNFLGSGGAINVNVPGQGVGKDESPLTFGNPLSPSGHLVFTGNSAKHGGAVGAYFDNINQNAVLDFRGLESITFNGNSADLNGGGISSSFVTIGDNVVFSGNSAGNAGGGISSSFVTIGDNVVFSDNSAGSAGGGISSSFVTIGDNVVFSGNSAGDSGGGILSFYSVTIGNDVVFSDNSADCFGGGISSLSSVTLGSNALFSGNSAGGSARGLGGAINTENLTLGAHTLFSGNLVGKKGSPDGQSQGAAVYLRGDTSGIALLNTGTGVDAGAIAFKGNYRAATLDAANPISGAIANSLHLEKNTKLHIKGAGNVYFDDPISSGSRNDAKNSLHKQGTGFVQFAGKNVLNTAGISASGANVHIEGGTFRLVSDGSAAAFDATGSGVFEIDQNATLAGAGTITPGTEFYLRGNIAPDSDRFEVPHFNAESKTFAAGRDLVAFGRRIGTLTLNGNVKLLGATLNIDIDSTNQKTDRVAVQGGAIINSAANKLNLTSWGVVTSSVVLSGNGAHTSLFNQSATTYLGQPLPSASAGLREMKATLDNGPNFVTLTTEQSDNKRLRWNAGDGPWNLTQKNWIDLDSSGPLTNFIAGDYVIFDGGATITLAGQGQVVSGMEVVNGSFIFNGPPGAAIYGQASAKNLPVPASGQLKLNTSGLTTLNLATFFENGTSMSQGVLLLNHDQALGLWEKGEALASTGVGGQSQAGQLLISQEAGHGNAVVAVNADRNLTNRFQIGRRHNRSGGSAAGEVYDQNASLSFNIATDKTLTISGVHNTSDDYYLGVGGAIAVHALGQGLNKDESPLKFANSGSPQGHLVLANNSADGGGAVGAYFDGSDQNAVLDFTGLQSVSVKDNKANWEGGGVYSFSSSPSSVTLGDKVVFSGNSAGGLGGGIYSSSDFSSSSSVTLGNNAFFSGNRAGGAPSGWGGAIYSGQDLSLGGNTLFSGNLVGNQDSLDGQSQGAAIFMAGNGTGTARLDATSGHIAFSGNYREANLSAVDPTSGALANSIHLYQNTKLELKGANNIYFDDPISSGTFGGNSLVKDGSGFVQFAGENILNSNDGAGGGVEVKDGTFRVVEGASFRTGGNDSKNFQVTSGGTLAGGGTIASGNGFAISGRLSPDARREETPDFDETTLAFAAGGATPTPSAFGTLTLKGDVTLDGATLGINLGASNQSDKVAVSDGSISYGLVQNKLDIGHWRNGTFIILTGTGDINGDNAASGFGGITVNGSGLGSRQGAKLDFSTENAVVLKTFSSNTNLTWTGGVSANWDSTDKNWKNPDSQADSYNANDYVIFDANGANRGITVASGGVDVSGMEVNGGLYFFSGGAIRGTDEVEDQGQTITGKLKVVGNTVATFNNIVDFSKGLSIGTGASAILDAGGSFGENGDMAIANDGTLSFVRSSGNDYTHSGVISGDGDLTKGGTGKVTLSGENAYSGNTSIIGGTLAATKAAALGTSAVSISAGSTFEMAISQGGQETFAQKISHAAASSALVKSGTGTAIISSDTDNFLGTTTVQAGTLLLDGSALGGNTTVQDKATLGGSGFLGDVKVQSGAYLAPGTYNGKDNGSFGSFMATQVDFEDGSVFAVKADALSATSDHLSANTVTIGSGVTVRHWGTGQQLDYSLDGSEWTILDPTNRTGEFADVQTNYAMLTPELIHNALDGSVTLKLTRLAGFESFAQTHNQRQVGKGLGGLDANNPLYNAVVGILGNDDNVRDAYDQLSGEMYSSLHGAVMESDRAFATVMLGRLAPPPQPAAGVGLVTGAPAEGQSEFWLNAEGFRSRTDKHDGTGRASYKGQGVSLGGEKRLGDFTLGGAFHYGDNDYKLGSRHSSADIDSFNFGLYGAYAFSDWQLKLGASYGLHQVDATRKVSVTNETLESDYNLHSFQAFSELAYRAAFGGFTVEPYLGAAWNYAHAESFSESGGSAALNSKADDNGNLSSTLGSRFYYRPTEKVTVALDLDWRHLYGDDRPDTRLAFSGGSSFNIEGAPLERDSFGAGLSVGVQFGESFTLRAGYNGRFGDDSDYNSGFMSMEYKF